MREVVHLGMAVLFKPAPAHGEELLQPMPAPSSLEPAAATPVPTGALTIEPVPAAEVVAVAAQPSAAEQPQVVFRAGSSEFWVKVLMSPGLYQRITNNRVMEVAFLLGISGVFLVNAAVAVVEPAGFVELVAHSPAAALLQTPAGPMIPAAIALNDFLIGAAVLAVLKLRALRGPVLAWAGAWLMLVTLLKIFAL